MIGGLPLSACDNQNTFCCDKLLVLMIVNCDRADWSIAVSDVTQKIPLGV